MTLLAPMKRALRAASPTDSEGINGLTKCQTVLSDQSRPLLRRTGMVGGGSSTYYERND